MKMTKPTNKLPRKVKIGPYNYVIKLYPDATTTDYGACVYNHQTIFLSANQHAERAGDTLLHEILHAIWDVAGFDVMPELHEESIVRSTATMLSAVLRDNPQIAAFILDPNKLWIPDYEEEAIEEASE
jgi:Zn-dependent peptidase ImmA (M78 family)